MQKEPAAEDMIPQKVPLKDMSTASKSPLVTISTTPAAASPMQIHSLSVTARFSENAVQPVTNNGPKVTMSAAVAALLTSIDLKKVHWITSIPQP